MYLWGGVSDRAVLFAYSLTVTRVMMCVLAFGMFQLFELGEEFMGMKRRVFWLSFNFVCLMYENTINHGTSNVNYRL